MLARTLYTMHQIPGSTPTSWDLSLTEDMLVKRLRVQNMHQLKKNHIVIIRMANNVMVKYSLKNK